MAILKVARLGHPVLRKVAERVDPASLRTSAVQRLIDDMIETMREYDGAGLAATQVHTLKQIAVLEVLGNPRYPDAPAVPLMVLVNPVVTPLTDEMEEGWEGCLSVPGLRGVVPRYTRIRYGGFDPDGRAIDREAEGFHARVVQHECDHLIGRLYPTRMRDLTKLGYTSVLFPDLDDAGDD
jgi:peptide deformylase